MNKYIPLAVAALVGLFVARKAGANIPAFNIPLLGSTMKLDTIGADFIKRHEGLRLEAYKDVGGRWTIGYGHLLPAGKDFEGYTISRAEADTLFYADVKVAEKAVNNYVTVPLTQNQFNALVSWTFNLGQGNLQTSTMLKVLNAGDYEAAASELQRWIYAGGKVVSGLVNRRQDEANLFIA